MRDKVQRELAELSEETGEEEGKDENATTTELQQRKEKNALSAKGVLFGDVYCQNLAGGKGLLVIYLRGHWRSFRTFRQLISLPLIIFL